MIYEKRGIAACRQQFPYSMILIQLKKRLRTRSCANSVPLTIRPA
jgi:hypothetical protein